MPERPEDWKAYEPRDEAAGEEAHAEARGDSTPAAPYDSSGTFQTYDARKEKRRRRRGRLGLLGIEGIGVVIGVVATATAFVSTLDDDDFSEDGGDTVVEIDSEIDLEEGAAGPDVFSDAGVADLAAALRQETGSTRVLEAVIYAGNAVVTVPGREPGDPARAYHWDGSLTDAGAVRPTREPFDLTRLDGDVLAELCEGRPVGGGSADQCFVVAGRPAPGDGDAWLTVLGGGPGDVPLRTDLRGDPA